MAYPQTIWDNVQQKNQASRIFWLVQNEMFKSKDGRVVNIEAIAQHLHINVNYCKSLYMKYNVYHHEPVDRKEALYRTRLVYEKKL
jgi:hypothetical protein